MRFVSSAGSYMNFLRVRNYSNAATLRTYGIRERNTRANWYDLSINRGGFAKKVKSACDSHVAIFPRGTGRALFPASVL